jgi:hypothetical protein
MNEKKIIVVEICSGLALIVIGVLLLLWSRKLYWIAIYPPPIWKHFIETLPYVFWSVGALLVLDGLRRLFIITNSEHVEHQSRKKTVKPIEKALTELDDFISEVSEQINHAEKLIVPLGVKEKKETNPASDENMS